MKMRDYIHQIWDYNYWARDRVWACVCSISDEDYMHHVDYSMGSVHAQCVHTMWAEAIWLASIKGEPSPKFLPADFANHDEVKAKWDSIQAEWLEYLYSLTEADLDRSFGRRSTSMNGTFSQTIGQVLIHVVNHGTDHRAQILRLLHDFGVETVAQDMIFYFREKNAEKL